MKEKINSLNKIQLFFTVLLAPPLSLIILGSLVAVFNDIEITGVGLIVLAGSLIAYPFMIIFGVPLIILLESNTRIKPLFKSALYILGGTLPSILFTLIIGLSLFSLLAFPAGIICAIISAMLMKR